jgi:DNA modification methylase
VTPYYSDDFVTLYNCDCREILGELPKVDLVVTSPPYNQRLNTFKPSGFKKGGVWAQRAASAYFDDISEGDYQSQQIEVLNLLWSATSEKGSLFYNHKLRWRDGECLHPIHFVCKSDWVLRQEIIWHRNGSVTQNAKMFPPNEERFIWMDKGAHKWNQEAARFLSVWTIASESNSEHPVAFPIEIPSRAILATTDSGDIVLDPYCGSATTLAAAKRLGRKSIGIEINERYAEIAARRLQQEYLPLTVAPQPKIEEAQLL